MINEKLSRIKTLEIKIRAANVAYYTSAKPVMTDGEFDELKDELQRLDTNNPILLEVGAPVDRTPLAKLKHTIPMGSLNKCNTEEEFLAWAKKMGTDEFVAQQKLDGMSVELCYKNGGLVCAITRGSGREGEDITHNVIHMQNVKAALPNKFSGSLRGEVLLYTGTFDKHFKATYSNPRNSVAGVARALDTKLAQHLKILYFDCLPVAMDFTGEKEKIEYIAEILHLETVPYTLLSTKNAIKGYNLYVESMRNALDYEIDGLVIKVNNIYRQHELDEEGSLIPASQIAWKFPAATAQTVLKNISWELGLTGRITPVANLVPVKVGGVMVERATLHNYRRIKQYGIVDGATVLISRRGDVIPGLEKVISKPDGATIASPPTKCPVCGGATHFEGEHLLCSNDECTGKVYGDFVKFIRILGVDECGEAFLETILENRLVKDVADLYNLKVEDIANLPGYGEQSATVILTNLKAKSSMRLSVFFASMNIPGCSVATFEALEKMGLNSVDKVLSANVVTLNSAEGIGEKTAKALVSGLDRKRPAIQKLLKYITIEEKKMGKLRGKSFCFTGEICIRREVAQQLVRDNGGEVKTSVSKGLTYLVQADPSSQSGKSKKALQYGTKIMGEEEFLALVEFDPSKLG